MNAQQEIMLPPQNLDAERSVIGSCLRYETFRDVQAILCPEDFYDFANRSIFEAMIDLDRRGVGIDLVTVADWIEGHNLSEDVTRQYLIEVTEAWISPAVVPKAQIVRSKATMRALHRLCRETMAEIDRPSMPEEEIIASAEKSLYQISQRRFSKIQTETVGEVINRTVDRIDERTIATRQGRHAATGVPSSFSDLDFFTGGFKESELTIVAARPGVGKTAFGINLFYSAMVYYKMPCLFFSLEQSSLELGERLICIDSLVDSHRIRRGFLSEEEGERIAEARVKIAPLTSWINAQADMSMSRVASECRRLKAKNGVRMMILDYLQLVDTENRYDQRHLQVGDTSRRLKLLAKELDIPVIAMAQLNRNSEDRRPRLSDLRESGSIEQDADNVIILHDSKKGESGPSGEIEVIIAKQRNGPTGDMTLVFDRRYTRFYNHATT